MPHRQSPDDTERSDHRLGYRYHDPHQLLQDIRAVDPGRFDQRLGNTRVVGRHDVGPEWSEVGDPDEDQTSEGIQHSHFVQQLVDLSGYDHLREYLDEEYEGECPEASLEPELPEGEACCGTDQEVEDHAQADHDEGVDQEL